ncbi:MAG: hypothetical protein ACTTKD_09390 [Peptoanaerobacter stomatis]|uniref:hypothetical protein n=1 Tax=Peptoanaerobacter stomatis TaxID=796937 RepID=UPI003F9F8D47
MIEYIPLRAIFESMGLKVEYNKDTKTVQAINYQDAKVWNKADIDKDFPDLNKSLNRYTLYDGTVGYDNDFNIENIKLDYSLKDKLRLGENNGEKWIEVHNKEKNQLLAFIKDGKVVYRSHIGTDSSYGRNHGYWSMDYEQDKDGYDIAKVDYILLYRYDNPFAILVENPFKRGDM